MLTDTPRDTPFDPIADVPLPPFCAGPPLEVATGGASPLSSTVVPVPVVPAGLAVLTIVTNILVVPIAPVPEAVTVTVSVPDPLPVPAIVLFALAVGYGAEDVRRGDDECVVL